MYINKYINNYLYIKLYINIIYNNISTQYLYYNYVWILKLLLYLRDFQPSSKTTLIILRIKYFI